MADHLFEYEKARAAGVKAASSDNLGYDDCPYDGNDELILRAIWQDGFLTTKLYGSG